MKYDFGGYATRNDLTCSDGRVIKKDAFKAQNGQTVPLVWNHNHDDVNDVLGLAHLENRKDGVYAYCEFNDTDNGCTAWRCKVTFNLCKPVNAERFRCNSWINQRG